MMHPNTELRFIDHALGFGVFAGAFIPKGTITWALDDLDRAVDASVVASLDEDRKERFLNYTYRDRDGRYLLLWDHGRYMNHDFNANTVATAYEFELAVRDILPGEELTCDYRALNIDFPLESLREGADNGRVVRIGEMADIYREVDRKIGDAFSCFASVDQPLRHLVGKEYREKIVRITERGEMPDSILTTFYDRVKNG